MKKGEAEFKGNFKENGSYLEPKLREFELQEEKDLVKFNHTGEQSHIFFGHGIRKDDVSTGLEKTLNFFSSQEEISEQQMNWLIIYKSNRRHFSIRNSSLVQIIYILYKMVFSRPNQKCFDFQER